MDVLSAFGLVAVTAMLAFYALEDRSPWFVLAFAAACALGSLYGFLQGAWPFGVIEAIWASAPLPKFVIHRRILRYELRRQRGTSNVMIPVPLSI